MQYITNVSLTIYQTHYNIAFLFNLNIKYKHKSSEKYPTLVLLVKYSKYNIPISVHKSNRTYSYVKTTENSQKNNRPQNYPKIKCITDALYTQIITKLFPKLLKSEFIAEYKYHENSFSNVTKP